jgi:PAS domain S-box-containing protein
MKILYVEDEIAHVVLTERTLQENLRQEFRLLHVETIREALEILDSHSDVDLILSDLRLPDGTGLDLLKSIRERKSPPAMVLVTGQGDEQVAVAALKAGAADYLVKQSDYLHRLPVVISNAVAQNRFLREQEALRQAEVKYQSLIEQISAVVFLDQANEEQTPLYVSPRIQELTGYTAEEWKADPWLWAQMIHPDDQERVLAKDKASNSTGSRFVDEYRIRRRDGSIVWVKVDANLIRDKEGAPLYWQGILLDITKEKETEAAMQRRLEEIAVLHSASVAASNSSQVDQLIEQITNVIGDTLYPDNFGIMLLSETSSTLKPHASYRGAAPASMIYSLPLTEGIAGKVARTGKPIRLGDVTQEESYIEVTKGVLSELCVPIVSRGHVIGVINTESKKPNAYSERDEHLLLTIAHTLATAMDKLRSFEEARQRATELEVLYRASRSLTLSLEPEIIGKNLIATIDELLGYESASVYLLDEQNNLLVPVAMRQKTQNSEEYNRGKPALLHTRLPVGTGMMARVVQQAQTIRTGTVTEDSHYFATIKNIQSRLCLPLMARRKVIGVLNVESTKSDAYTERDESLLTALANSAAIAFENARLYKSEQKRRQEAENLRQAASIISSTLDIDTVVKEILKALKQVIPYDNASVFFHEGDQLRVAMAEGFPNANAVSNLTFRADDELFQIIRQTGRPIILQDAQADPRFKSWGGTTQVRGWMAIPLVTRGNVVGCISLDNYKVGAYQESIVDTALAFANQAAAGIENARLFEEQSRRAKIIEALADIANEIATTREVFPALDQIARRALTLLNANHIAIYLLQDDHATLKTVTAHGEYRNELLGHTRKVGEGITGNVFLNGKPEIINTTQEDARRVIVPGTPAREKKLESLMCSPLILRGKPIGIINAWRLKENGLFNESELNFLVGIAHQVSICIESGRLFQETNRQAQEAAAIAEVGRDISATLQLDTVLERIASYAMDLLSAETSAVYLADSATSTLRAIAALGVDAEEIKADPLINGTGILGNMALQSIGEIVNNTENDPRSIIVKGTEEHPFEHLMGVPILLKEKHTGLLAVWRSGEGTEFAPRELEFLTSLAQQAAVAIENARLYDETQRRLHELETINRVSTSLRRTQSLDDMLPILLSESLQLTGTPHGSIWLYDHTTDRLVQRIASGSENDIAHKALSTTVGILGYTFQSAKIYRSTELKSDARLFEGNRDSMVPGHSAICIPIQSTAGPVGVLSVIIPGARQIAEEVNLLTILAEITGNSIHRALLYDQSQKQVRRLTSLRDIDSAIASSVDLRLTMKLLMDQTMNHLGVDAVSIGLYHPDIQTVSYLCGVGFSVPSPTRPQVRAGMGLTGQVISRQETVFTPDLQSAPEAANEILMKRENFIVYMGIPLIVKGQLKGVFEVFHRSPLSPTPDWMEFLHTLAGQAAIAIDSAQLFEKLQRSNQELLQAYDTTLEGWARALELRDRETEGHTRRVTELTMQLARYIGVREDEQVNLYRGVLLHDIGKMGVPDHILKKTGKLTDNEWDEMRRHPIYAYNLLAPISFLRGALEIPYCHHEWWNGNGYPRGLKGEQIPLGARIFSVVDNWDALLSDRPYRKAWPRDQVIAHLKEKAGIMFDPKIVHIFLTMIEQQDDLG